MYCCEPQMHWSDPRTCSGPPYSSVMLSWFLASVFSTLLGFDIQRKGRGDSSSVWWVVGGGWRGRQGVILNVPYHEKEQWCFIQAWSSNIYQHHFKHLSINSPLFRANVSDFLYNTEKVQSNGQLFKCWSSHGVQKPWCVLELI